jgi:hypothetical protein
MSSIYNENIQGNLSTSRDITAGGHLNVRGNSVFGHNVVIKGWLDAKNIKGPCKGLYASEETLNEAYPKPMPGWYALVGNTLPANVYRSDGGKWVATGEQGGEVNLYLDQLEEDVANLDDDVKDIQELIGNGFLVAGSVQFNATATEVTLTYKLRKSDGTETPYNVTVPIVTPEKAGMMSAADKQSLAKVLTNITELEQAVWPLTASFSASPSVIEYTGQAQETTLSWTVKRKGANATVTSLTVKQGSNNVYSGTVNPGSQKVSVNTKGSTKYDLSATADGLTVTGSAVVNMVLPMYFGFAEATSASALNITSLTKQSIKTSPGGTYTLTNGTEGHYMWLCVPSTMTINKVTLNGFDVPMEAAQSGSTSLGGYKCYRSSNALQAQSFTIVVS